MACGSCRGTEGGGERATRRITHTHRMVYDPTESEVDAARGTIRNCGEAVMALRERTHAATHRHQLIGTTHARGWSRARLARWHERQREEQSSASWKNQLSALRMEKPPESWTRPSRRSACRQRKKDLRPKRRARGKRQRGAGEHREFKRICTCHGAAMNCAPATRGGQRVMPYRAHAPRQAERLRPADGGPDRR